MVMTLRKREKVPLQIQTPYSPSSSSSSSHVRDSRLRKRKALTRSSVSTKPKPKARFAGKENAYPGSSLYDSSSESESGSESSSSSEKEEDEACVYEKLREQRMRENRERMEKLGIFSLSLQFNAGGTFNKKKKKAVPPVKKPRNGPLYPRPPRAYDPSRRSDRLKSLHRGQYIETEGSLIGMGIIIPEAFKSEVYTKEDEKLLGDCQAKWDLNVDGFGEDGERLYDPINGTSCHQCRQKTLRKHTFCGKCRSPQGQLCGDCLYTRYGENVVEIRENPHWMCPACRGICNCSRCRRTKGWPPVTILYPKVVELCYKSVAHYLILSRRAGAMSKEVDLEGSDQKEGETQPPLGYEGSDTSAEWSESDDDDSDHPKVEKKNTALSEPMHAEDADLSNQASKDSHSCEPAAMASCEPAGSADGIQGMDKPRYDECSNIVDLDEHSNEVGSSRGSPIEL